MGWRRYRRRRLLINLKTGKAVEGILWDAPRGILALRHAELLDSGGKRTPIDGDFLVETTNVDFVQALAPELALGRTDTEAG